MSFSGIAKTASRLVTAGASSVDLKWDPRFHTEVDAQFEAIRALDLAEANRRILAAAEDRAARNMSSIRSPGGPSTRPLY